MMMNEKKHAEWMIRCHRAAGLTAARAGNVGMAQLHADELVKLEVEEAGYRREELARSQLRLKVAVECVNGHGATVRVTVPALLSEASDVGLGLARTEAKATAERLLGAGSAAVSVERMEVVGAIEAAMDTCPNCGVKVDLNYPAGTGVHPVHHLCTNEREPGEGSRQRAYLMADFPVDMSESTELDSVEDLPR